MGLTAVVVQVLGLGVVGVDEGETVVQPAHLDRVPRLPQLPQPRQLVHHLLLLRHPQRSEVTRLFTKGFRIVLQFKL